MRCAHIIGGVVVNFIEVNDPADLPDFVLVPAVGASISVGDRWGGRQFAASPASPLDPEQVQADIVQATQQRLDDFARARNYDGILSACTYATSAVPAFQSEGRRAVGLRDATWAKLYEMLAEVQAGTRPAPGSFADIEPELPALRWPA